MLFSCRPAVTWMHLGLLVVGFSATSPAKAQLIDRYYTAVHDAQASNRYQDMIAQITGQSNLRGLLLDNLSDELEQLKKATNEERRSAFKSLFNLGQDNSSSPLRFETALKTTISELERGFYDSRRVANVLLNRTIEHEIETVTGFALDAERTVRGDYPTQKVLFLSPDFSSVYLKIAARGVLDNGRLVYSPLPTFLKEAATSGRFDEVRNYFAGLGITAESVLRDGLLIFDSSPSGYNARFLMSVLTATVLPQSEKNQILSRISVRNFYARNRDAVNIKEQIKAKNKEMTAQEIGEMLLKPMEIREIRRTVSLDAGPGSRSSDSLTFRPKAISPDPGTPTNQPPKTVAARLRFLLGLAADVASFKTARGPGRFVNYPWLSEIDAAMTQGRHAVEDYVDRPSFEIERSFKSVEVKPTGDAQYPWELLENGKRVTRLSKVLGEGNNVRVYLTENNTAMKIVKSARDARKQLLLSWAYNLMRLYDMDAAKVFNVQSEGIYLEMEYVPGASLEGQWGKDPKSLPPAIRSQILDHFRKAKKLALERGIWLDLKSANFHVATDGRILNVDYVPRTNGTYYRFFQEDNGTAFSDERFLDMFLTYDLKKIEEARRREQERLDMLERMRVAELERQARLQKEREALLQKELEERLAKEAKAKLDQEAKAKLEQEAKAKLQEARANQETVYAAANEETIEVSSSSGKHRSRKHKREKEERKCGNLLGGFVGQIGIGSNDFID